MNFKYIHQHIILRYRIFLSPQKVLFAVNPLPHSTPLTINYLISVLRGFFPRILCEQNLIVCCHLFFFLIVCCHFFSCFLSLSKCTGALSMLLTISVAYSFYYLVFHSTSLFIHLSVDRPLSCFQISSSMNKAAYICLQIFLWTKVFISLR